MAAWSTGVAGGAALCPMAAWFIPAITAAGEVPATAVVAGPVQPVSFHIAEQQDLPAN
jgi:hypothetical protein